MCTVNKTLVLLCRPAVPVHLRLDRQLSQAFSPSLNIPLFLMLIGLYGEDAWSLRTGNIGDCFQNQEVCALLPTPSLNTCACSAKMLTLGILLRTDGRAWLFTTWQMLSSCLLYKGNSCCFGTSASVHPQSMKISEKEDMTWFLSRLENLNSA